jgi:hydroxyacylglutathione hydrolase
MTELSEIYTINLWQKNWLLKSASGVNSYLIKTDSGFFLIDTGFHSKNKELELALENYGCKPSNLNLIIITHGDLDHIGNCKSLQKNFKVKIAVHSGESEAILKANMTLNRKKKQSISTKIVLSLFGSLFKTIRFLPDIFVNDGDSLLKYGLNAEVLHLPGHSKGSLGILTTDGNLFCGDLLLNIHIPSQTDLLDDPVDLKNSINRLLYLPFHTIYPGHGKPFTREQFIDLIYNKIIQTKR